MKLRIIKQQIVIFLLIIPYLKPYNITLLPAVDNIFKVWKIISTVAFIAVFIVKKNTVNYRVVCLILFCGIWIMSLAVNHDTSMMAEYLNNILSILGITLFLYGKNDDKSFKKNLSKVLYLIGAFYMPLTLITAIIGRPFFAQEMELADNANFLGGDNYSAFILIVLCGLMFFYDCKYRDKTRLRTWVIAFSGLLSLILPLALTGIIAYSLLLVFVAVKNYSFSKKIINWKTVLLLSLAIVFSVSHLKLDVLLSTILNSLDKSGFNGRNFVWTYSIRAITQKPIIGYGGVSEELTKTWILAGMNHTHNILLQYPFSVGILGTCFFTFYFVMSMRGLNIKYDKSLALLYFTLVAFLVCSIFDFYIGLVYFYLLIEFLQLFRHEKTASEVLQGNDYYEGYKNEKSVII